MNKRGRGFQQNNSSKEVQPFTKEWYACQSESHKKWFEGVLGALFFLLVAVAGAIFIGETDSGYHRLHGGLFLICLGFFSLLIVRRSDLLGLLRNARRVISKDKTVGIWEIGDAVYLFSLLLAVVAFLFIVDASFFENGGLRIGAVAAFGLLSLLKGIFHSLRRR